MQLYISYYISMFCIYHEWIQFHHFHCTTIRSEEVLHNYKINQRQSCYLTWSTMLKQKRYKYRHTRTTCSTSDETQHRCQQTRRTRSDPKQPGLALPAPRIRWRCSAAVSSAEQRASISPPLIPLAKVILDTSGWLSSKMYFLLGFRKGLVMSHETKTRMNGRMFENSVAEWKLFLLIFGRCYCFDPTPVVNLNNN